MSTSNEGTQETDNSISIIIPEVHILECKDCSVKPQIINILSEGFFARCPKCLHRREAFDILKTINSIPPEGRHGALVGKFYLVSESKELEDKMDMKLQKLLTQFFGYNTTL